MGYELKDLMRPAGAAKEEKMLVKERGGQSRP